MVVYCSDVALGVGHSFNMGVYHDDSNRKKQTELLFVEGSGKINKQM